MDVIDTPSPNFGPRRDGLRPRLIVLHYTAMQSARAALERLCTTRHEVSAHYLIGTDGTVYRLVAEDKRAWHAGAGSWAGVEDINSRSIGIELANRGREPFAHAQMCRLEEVLRGVMDRWDIPPAGVIGHSCMAPGRKSDPGPRFDWKRLARQNLGVWHDAVAPGPADAQAFTGAACAFGYPDTPETLEAFRLRFRPWARGAPLDGWDVSIAQSLARLYP